MKQRVPAWIVNIACTAQNAKGTPVDLALSRQTYRIIRPSDYTKGRPMISVDYVQRMARYNRWQNENLYETASRLADEERRREREAFFGSIHRTLSHLMWADRLWMSRFCGTQRPQGAISESASLYPDWDLLRSQRVGFDAEIMRWAEDLSPDWLAGELTYFSQSSARDIRWSRWMLVSHFFNHQTHHRGQVHCMLTQAGMKPQDTDLTVMPG